MTLQVFHDAFNLNGLQSTYRITIDRIGLPCRIINLDRIQVISRILPVDTHRFHLPFRIGQTQGRVTKEHIAFFLLPATRLGHTIDITQSVMLFALNAEQIVVDTRSEILVMGTIGHTRCCEHGNHAAILVEEGIFAQRGTHVVVVAAELAGTRNHQGIHRSISP